MQVNRFFSPPAAEPIAEKQAVGKYILGGLLWAAAGFLAAKASVLGTLSPFGIAYGAAVKKNDAPAAIIGAMIGYIAFAPPGFVKYVLAMLLLAGLRWQNGLFSRIPKPGAAAGALAVPSAVLLAVTNGTIYDSLLAVSEVLLAGCASYFFARTLNAFQCGVENLRQADLFSFVITLSIAVLALVPFSFFQISLGRILAGTAILLSARLAQEAGGAVAGIIQRKKF